MGRTSSLHCYEPLMQRGYAPDASEKEFRTPMISRTLGLPYRQHCYEVTFKRRTSKPPAQSRDRRVSDLVSTHCLLDGRDYQKISNNGTKGNLSVYLDVLTARTSRSCPYESEYATVLNGTELILQCAYLLMTQSQ